MKADKINLEQKLPVVKANVEQVAKTRSEGGVAVTGGIQNITGKAVSVPSVGAELIAGQLESNSVFTAGMKSEDAQNTNQTTN